MTSALNKNQQKQVEMVKLYINNNMMDNAAMVVSSMIRSSMTSKSRYVLMAFANDNNLTHNHNFIV